MRQLALFIALVTAAACAPPTSTVDPTAAKQESYVVGAIEAYGSDMGGVVEPVSATWFEAVESAATANLNADACVSAIDSILELVIADAAHGKVESTYILEGSGQPLRGPLHSELTAAAAIWRGVKTYNLIESAASPEAVDEIMAAHNAQTLQERMAAATDADIERAAAAGAVNVLRRDVHGVTGNITVSPQERECLTAARADLHPAG